jgi:diguanylate cyclase (GGDEF)-like protein/PAS domain S-box-containing protein
VLELTPEIGAVFLLAAAVLAATSLFLWARFRRYRRRVSDLRKDVLEVAASSHGARRIPVGSRFAEIDDLGQCVNQLFEALESKESQARKRVDLFHDLANTLPEVVLIHHNKILFANREAGVVFGEDPRHLIGRDVTDLVRPAYRSRAGEIIRQQLAGEKSGARYELQLTDAEGRARWAEVTGVRMRYKGKPVVLTVARDITHRKSVEATLGRSRAQAQTTLESLAEGIITCDIEGRIDYMNGAAEKLTGIRVEQAIGHPFADVIKLVDEGDKSDLVDPVSHSLATRKRVSLGRRALLMPANGDGEVSIDATASPITKPDGEVIGVAMIMRDVGELRGFTREMSYHASHDALTGLVNRREFERQVNSALDVARQDNSSHVLCYMDLDRFKAVNDTCGHLAGDNMLREVANLLREQVRDSDVLGRLGGDEFALLLAGCPLDKARQIAQDICNAVEKYRFSWRDRIFDIGISIGLVEIDQQSNALEDVISAADSACYIAKQEGRGRVHVYSARDAENARQRGDIHWLRKLQVAIRDNAFELLVQPIISVTGRIPRGPAVEVYLRLRDEDGQLHSPREFVRTAERYHLMGELDRWVVQATLSAVASGAIRLPDERSVSINLSGQTMADDAFLDFVVTALDHSEVNPAQICFEVSEPAVLQDARHARRFIGVLHGMGCSFALDDFGSHVGSIASLKGLDLDFLKLDGVYTRDLEINGVSQEVVSSVTRLSRAVGFKVIAEQVEDQSSFDSLRDLGVNFIQGNYVEAPRQLG